jgi:hypothetical protein
VDATGYLHIERESSATKDPYGIVIKNKDSSGNINSVSTAEALEWGFPAIISGNIPHVQLGSNPPVTSPVGYLEPGDSEHLTACTYDFKFSPVLLEPLPKPIEKPKLR